MSGPTIDDAIAAFDDEALLRNMLRVAAEHFPPFAGAPERLVSIRNRAAALLEAAPELLRNLRFARCSHCGERYEDRPEECFLADHIEAHDAIAKAGAA